ncbi:MAG: SufS family cysteine desulfurase [Candidatus Riflebacteria bacterium]|nr:SufS family cysteine desulfurase [Candidatus Riflebacteria bacterium]
MLAAKADFPLLGTTMRGRSLVYLDSAATTQKPRAVIEALTRAYECGNANVHRGAYELSERATALYEETRERVARFVGAGDPREIVFTRNATEAINLVARSWALATLKQGDELIVSEIEHHSNLVPWQEVARITGARLSHLELRPDGTLDLGAMTSRTKLVAVTGASNVLGTIVPVRRLVGMAHAVGALVLVDGAQMVPQMPVNVTELGCDFLAFSSHKMLGPTGVGVLWARRELLEAMEPIVFGGGMIREVWRGGSSFGEVPWRFEAGTSSYAEVVAFGEALRYLGTIGMAAVREHEKTVAGYALGRLLDDGRFELYGPLDPEIRAGVVSFNFGAIHPHDVATILDGEGIAVRAGHHCCMPLMRKLGVAATVRASVYVYNGQEDIDRLLSAFGQVERIFGKQRRGACRTDLSSGLAPGSIEVAGQGR